MAKQADGDINKSEELRQYLRKHPEAGAATIIPVFAKRGIEIKRSLVSWVKQDMKKKGELGDQPSAPVKKVAAKKAPTVKTQKSAPTKATVSPTPPAKAQAEALSADDLMEAKKLVDELGGIEQVRRALKYLEELS